MATNKVCDHHENMEAVITVEVKSDRTTTVKADLCQECFLEFKAFLHWLTGQNPIVSPQVKTMSDPTPANVK